MTKQRERKINREDKIFIIIITALILLPLNYLLFGGLEISTGYIGGLIVAGFYWK
jgi:hypothetical protein